MASPDPSAGLAAARAALQARAPVLLTSARSNPFSGTAVVVSAMLGAQLRALDPHAVLAVGIAANVLAAQLPGLRVVTDPATARMP